MPDLFNPADWYWQIVGEARVWSSARLGFFPDDDEDYLDWCESAGGEAVPLVSAVPAAHEAELQSVLRAAGLPSCLTDIVAARRYVAEIGGVTFEGHRYATDRETQAKYAGAAMMAQLNPAAIFEWKALDGFVTLDAAGMLAVATAAGAHVQACFALEASLTAAIAEGTVTTAEEIDGAEWPGGAA